MSTLNCHKNGFSQPEPAWTTRIPESRYHEDALTGKILSSGMLKEFRLCPAHYHALITGKARRSESDALRFGRAVHKLILEGDRAYRDAFMVGGPINEKTGRAFGSESKTFEKWLEEYGLERERTLTPGEAEDIVHMREAVRSHREAGLLLSSGWPELSARAELQGIPCQIRLDWLCPDGVAVDLKTCSDIARFEADARRFGYLNQFAFYRDVAQAAGAGEVTVVAVVLEKRQPFRVGVWRFPDDILAPYSAQNRTAIAALHCCRERGRWPTGYEGTRAFPPAGLPPVWLN